MRLNHLLLSSLLATSSLHAAEEHDHDHHAGLSAHVHGEAELLIALEANKLQLQLSSPAANLVGFEHMPRTQQQKDALTALKKTLANSGSLFVIPTAADCQLSEYQIESSLLEQEHGEHEEHAQHSEDKHDDHHKQHDEHDEDKHHEEHAHHNKDEHDEHDEQHKHHDDHGEGKHAEESAHADFDVSWAFNCTHPDKLDALEVTLFNKFPALEKLSTQWISERGQGGATLTPAKQRLSLR